MSRGSLGEWKTEGSGEKRARQRKKTQRRVRERERNVWDRVGVCEGVKQRQPGGGGVKTQQKSPLWTEEGEGQQNPEANWKKKSLPWIAPECITYQQRMQHTLTARVVGAFQMLSGSSESLSAVLTIIILLLMHRGGKKIKRKELQLHQQTTRGRQIALANFSFVFLNLRVFTFYYS